MKGPRAIDGSRSHFYATDSPFKNEIGVIDRKIEPNSGSGQERRCDEFGPLL